MKIFVIVYFKNFVTYHLSFCIKNQTVTSEKIFINICFSLPKKPSSTDKSIQSNNYTHCTCLQLEICRMDDFGDRSNQNATSAREETSKTNRDLIAWSKLSKIPRFHLIDLKLNFSANRFIPIGQNFQASMKFKIENG